MIAFPWPAEKKLDELFLSLKANNITHCRRLVEKRERHDTIAWNANLLLWHSRISLSRLVYLHLYSKTNLASFLCLYTNKNTCVNIQHFLLSAHCRDLSLSSLRCLVGLSGEAVKLQGITTVAELVVTPHHTTAQCVGHAFLLLNRKCVAISGEVTSDGSKRGEKSVKYAIRCFQSVPIWVQMALQSSTI